MAENTAHRAVITDGCLDTDSTVNLDGDIIVAPEFIEHAISTTREMNQPDSKCVGVQYGCEDTGCTGRILMSVRMFRHLGGYDEDLPYPAGCQDVDLRKRLMKIGTVRYVRDVRKVGFPCRTPAGPTIERTILERRWKTSHPNFEI